MAGPKGIDWSDLPELMEQGLRYYQISKMKGCHPTNVSYMAGQMGLRRPRSRAWPIEQIRQWVEGEDRTLQWVADQLGCRNQTISKLCAKHGIETKGVGPRPGSKHYAFRGGKSGGLGHFQSRKVLREARVRLAKGAVVHHLNFDSEDQRLENMWIFRSQSEHMSWHRYLEERARAEDRSPLDVAREVLPPGEDRLRAAIPRLHRGRGGPALRRNSPLRPS